jgi:NAD(P)-dependent dehydrogenase (short-subunit alcohol dehydrogenase family)
LAKEGAHVVIGDINMELAEKTAAKVRETGRKSHVVKTDVRLKDQCKNLMETTLKEMGRIDILVCNAGVGGFIHRLDSQEPSILENISEADWDLTIDVNLKGVFLCNQAVTPYFKQQKKGKIINISSIGGRKGVDFVPHYSASKAGVIVWSQGIALQLAPYHINVNTICPGIIWTTMWEQGAKILEHTNPQFKGMELKDIFNAMVQHMIPMGRPQTPTDIGNAVVFLASDEASEITGQALNVCGGAMFN